MTLVRPWSCEGGGWLASSRPLTGQLSRVVVQRERRDGDPSALASRMREFERGLSACVAVWGHDWLRWDLARAI
jgi:hypothetical protein